VRLTALSQPQLADSLTIIRLTLHILAATIWVGGQFTVLGLLPTLRKLDADAPRQAARAFSRLSWPAYWLLIATGIWNYLSIDHANATSAWNGAFGVKMLCVVVAGIGALMHTRATSAKARGIYAGVGTLGSIAALILGVALAG
jgi:putative copper export protein